MAIRVAGDIHHKHFYFWHMKLVCHNIVFFSGWIKNDQMAIEYNDNDNDNILFDHNIEIEIIMYNSLENQIIDWSGDY